MLCQASLQLLAEILTSAEMVLIVAIVEGSISGSYYNDLRALVGS